MKKPHPCGNNIFIVMRAGADLRLKCAECGREIMIERIKAQKNIKKVMLTYLIKKLLKII